MSLVVLSEENTQLAASLDALAQAGLECQTLANNFSKTMLVAKCVQSLRKALTDDAMKPLMYLQGSKLGFRTDLDRDKNKYSVDVVRDAIIESSMLGLMPVGNQFNIIAGNMYVTKEGLTFLLANMQGLTNLNIKITLGETHEKEVLVRPKYKDPFTVVERDTEAKAQVRCVYNGVEIDETLDLLIRANAGMGHDAIMGKADRKAKAYLYSRLTGSSIGEGDASDAAPTPEMRNVTPAPAADKPARVSRGTAAGGLRAAAAPAPTPAPVKPTPAPVAQKPVPAPAFVPVGEELDISVPESDSAASPAAAVSSSAAPAPEDDERGVKLCHAFCREIERAWKAGHKQASVMEVINWMKAYMGMTDLAAPVEGMPWVMAIDMLISNHAVAFDRVFGTSFAQWKGVPEA